MARFYPPYGKKLVIIGQDNASIHAYTKAYGHAPAGIMIYTSLQSLGGISAPFDIGGGVQDLQSLISVYPRSAVQVGLHLGNGLEEITEGRYDSNIDYLAAFFEKLQRPVYLRIGYEFDMQKYNPKEYIHAYERIAARIQEKTSWASTVWHASCTPSPQYRILSEWFPSASLVDWIGGSYFPPKDFCMNQFDQIAAIAERHEKRLMIAESTVRGGLGNDSWEKWFAPYFEFIEQRDIVITCYISWNWESFNMFRGKGWGNTEIHSSLLFEKWKKELQKERYIASS